MSELVLEVSSADKAFQGQRILRNASIWAYAGQVTVLLGRNGCGKTTLLRIAAGFVRPDAGTVRFRGTWHPRPRLHRLARQGLAFAPAADFLPLGPAGGRTAATECRAGEGRGRRDPGARGRRRARADDVARPDDGRTVGRRAAPRRNRLRAGAPAAVPGGRRTVPGIAPTDCERLSGVFRRCAAAGAAVLLTGHQITWLMPVADRVIWCHDGTTANLGTPGDAASHDLLRQQYLGGPGVSR